MRQISFLLLFVIVFSCNSPTREKKPFLKNTVNKTGLYPILTEGDYTVDYLTNKEITSVQQALLHKVAELIRSGKSAAAYQQLFQDGSLPAYEPAMGISRKEYDQLIALFSDSEPLKMKGTLKIRRQGDRFSFEGQGRLSLLDSLVVNLDKQSAIFRHYNLGLVKDSIDLSGEDIPLGNSIEEYAYFKGPDGILGLAGMEGSVELLIATLKPEYNLYLSFIVRPPADSEDPFPKFISAISK